MMEVSYHNQSCDLPKVQISNYSENQAVRGLTFTAPATLHTLYYLLNSRHVIDVSSYTS